LRLGSSEEYSAEPAALVVVLVMAPVAFLGFAALAGAAVSSWLLLGVLVYPFLLGLGWWHTRTAERVEQNFADHVQE